MKALGQKSASPLNNKLKTDPSWCIIGSHSSLIQIHIFVKEYHFHFFKTLICSSSIEKSNKKYRRLALSLFHFYNKFISILLRILSHYAILLMIDECSVLSWFAHLSKALYLAWLIVARSRKSTWFTWSMRPWMVLKYNNT